MLQLDGCGCKNKDEKLPMDVKLKRGWGDKNTKLTLLDYCIPQISAILATCRRYLPSADNSATDMPTSDTGKNTPQKTKPAKLITQIGDYI